MCLSLSASDSGGSAQGTDGRTGDSMWYLQLEAQTFSFLASTNIDFISGSDVFFIYMSQSLWVCPFLNKESNGPKQQAHFSWGAMVSSVDVFPNRRVPQGPYDSLETRQLLTRLFSSALERTQPASDTLPSFDRKQHSKKKRGKALLPILLAAGKGNNWILAVISSPPYRLGL